MVNEKDLVANIKKGDASAFPALVTKYKKRAFGIAYLFVGNIEEAAEIAQDVFVKVYHSMERFDEKSSFYMWFYQILINLCLDFKKKKTSNSVDSSHFRSEDMSQEISGQWVQDDIGESPLKRLEIDELQGEIIKSVDILSEKQKVVFILRYYEKMPLKDIADLLTMPEGTVKSHLARSIGKLQELLRDVYEKEGEMSDEV